MNRSVRISSLILLALLIGCDAKLKKEPAVVPLPTVPIEVGSKTYQLEMAVEDKTRETGLMYRDSMPSDHGMIFAFPDEDIRTFWMRNTHIALDIVYADEKGQVVAVKPMRPLDLSSVSSDKPAKFAIELNRGQAEANGVKVGDVLKIPNAVVAKE